MAHLLRNQTTLSYKHACTIYVTHPTVIRHTSTRAHSWQPVGSRCHQWHFSHIGSVRSYVIQEWEGLVVKWIWVMISVHLACPITCEWHKYRVSPCSTVDVIVHYLIVGCRWRGSLHTQNESHEVLNTTKQKRNYFETNAFDKYATLNNWSIKMTIIRKLYKLQQGNLWTKF